MYSCCQSPAWINKAVVVRKSMKGYKIFAKSKYADTVAMEILWEIREQLKVPSSICSFASGVG